jgi:hypothetical protein
MRSYSRTSLLVIAILAVASVLFVVMPTQSKLIDGFWSRTAAAAAAGIPCPTGTQCEEWCRNEADGSITPTGNVCCIPLSLSGSDQLSACSANTGWGPN